MKGYGAVKKRCPHCGNLQNIITIDDAPTIFFKCKRCTQTIFLNEKMEVIMAGQMDSQ